MSVCPSSSKHLKAAVKSLDIFAKPIQLTYKGRNSYSTVPGGCFSAAIISIVAAFLFFRITL